MSAEMAGATAPMTSSSSGSSSGQSSGNTSSNSVTPGGSQGSAARSSGGNSAVTGSAATLGKESSDTTTNTSAPTTEELEEIKIGSVNGKVPKQLAKVIKDLERGFQSKAQEKAQYQKQVEAELRNLMDLGKKDFAQFAKRFGLDDSYLDQVAEQRLMKNLERAAMSPEARKAMELEQELAKYKQQEAQTKAQREAQEQERVYTEQSTKIKGDLMTAWKESGLPPDPYYGARMAAEMMRAQKSGANLSLPEIAARVKGEIFSTVGKSLEQMPVESILEVIPKAVIDKIRQYDIQRVTGQASHPNRPADQNAASEHKPKTNRFMSEKEWKAFMMS